MNKTVGLFWRACSFSLAVNFRLNDCDRHETASSELSTDSVSPPSSSLGDDEGLRISSGWHLNESFSRNFLPSLIFDILEREKAALMWVFMFIYKSVTVIGYIFPPLIMTSHWPLKETQSSRAARTTSKLELKTWRAVVLVRLCVTVRPVVLSTSIVFVQYAMEKLWITVHKYLI